MSDIIFDFGGVLLDIDIKLTVNALTALGLTELDPKHIHPQNSGIFLESEVGAISDDAFFEALGAMCTGTRPTRQQLEEAWDALLLPFNWSRFEMLDELRASGYGVYLLSNTNSPHHIFFERHFDRENPWGRTFTSFFDEVYYSDLLHLRKPGREIYEQVVRLSGVAPCRTLFVDDNAPNLMEPVAIGMHVHHLVAPQTVQELFGRE